MNLPERIKYVRKINKISQARFASELRVERSYVSKIETGALKPSVGVIARICLFFSINNEWLLEGKGEVFKKHSLEPVHRMYQTGQLTRHPKALDAIIDWLFAELEKMETLTTLLGPDIMDLGKLNLAIDDPFVFEVVKRLYRRIEVSASKSNAVKKQRGIEAAVLHLLDAMGIDSRKDIFALLLSKASRLPLETQKKLQDDLRCLQEVEREEEDS